MTQDAQVVPDLDGWTINDRTNFSLRRWEAMGKSHQLRSIADARLAAHISPPATFNVLRHTHAPHLAMAATPIGVIAAQLGQVDTRMAEKHYARLAPSYIADTIRASLPALGDRAPADLVSHAGSFGLSSSWRSAQSSFGWHLQCYWPRSRSPDRKLQLGIS